MVTFIHFFATCPGNMAEVLKLNVGAIESVTETNDGHAELMMISGKRYKSQDLFRDVVRQIADADEVSMEE